jgi:hypothetical protein
MSEINSSVPGTPDSDFIPNFRNGERLTPTPLKKIRSYLNKVTAVTLEKISEEMLTINILEDVDNAESQSSDKDNMLPVVETFISNVCVFERNDEAMNTYVKVFCKLTEKWRGRQGSVLMSTMMQELSKFFAEYKQCILDNEIEDKRRNQCFKLCRFVSLLYIENLVSLKLVVAFLETFCKTEKFSLEVFCKIFGLTYEKLKTEKIFVDKLMNKYKNFLKDNSESTELEYIHKFMCLECFEKM